MVRNYLPSALLTVCRSNVHVSYNSDIQYIIAKERRKKKEVSDSYCLALIAQVPEEKLWRGRC